MPKEFEGQFECLGENTAKYITFSVSIKKELKNGKTITYKLKFIDSFRFTPSSLSNLVDIFLKDFTIINAQIVNLVLNTIQDNTIQKYFFRKSISSRNEQNKSKSEQANTSRSVNTKNW